MSKESFAPWYVVLFRILCVLFFWIFGAAVFWCVPLWVDSILCCISDLFVPIFEPLFSSNFWACIGWGVVSLGLSAWWLLSSLADFGRRFLADPDFLEESSDA